MDQALGQHQELWRQYFLCQWRAAGPLSLAIVVLGGAQVGLPPAPASFIDEARGDEARGKVRPRCSSLFALLYLGLVLLGQIFQVSKRTWRRRPQNWWM